MDFVFESLNEKNVEQCVNLLLSSMKNQLLPIHQDKKILKRMIYRNYLLTLIAKREDRIVGIISGTALIPPSINLFTITDEISAREGLGSILIDKFIELVRRKLPKASYITTRLSTDNIVAISLYLMKDFRIEGFIRGRLEGKDIVLLGKKL